MWFSCFFGFRAPTGCIPAPAAPQIFILGVLILVVVLLFWCPGAQWLFAGSRCPSQVLILGVQIFVVVLLFWSPAAHWLYWCLLLPPRTSSYLFVLPRTSSPIYSNTCSPAIQGHDYLLNMFILITPLLAKCLLRSENYFNNLLALSISITLIWGYYGCHC